MNPLDWETSTVYSESSYASYTPNRSGKSLNSYYGYQTSNFGEWKGAGDYNRECPVRRMQNFMRVLVPARMIGPIMGKRGQTLKGK